MLETKNICDYLLDEIDANDVLFEHVPVDGTANYLSPPNPLPSFSNILLPKNKSQKRPPQKFLKSTKK